MSSTNRSSLAYVAEVTKGTTPANPAFKALRNTSDGIVGGLVRATSNEIRADRQVVDYVPTDLTVGGTVGIELSFSAFDDIIQAAFQGTWAAKPSIVVVTQATEISAVSTTTLTVAANLGTPYKANMLVFTSGFPTAANNGLLAPVVSSSSTTVVFGAATFTAETAPIPVGATARVVGFQGASGDITATATGLASTSLDFTTLGLNSGEWVKIGGDAAGVQFATAANNSWARIANGGVAAHALTFDVLPSGWTTDSGTGKTLNVFTGDFITTGTVQRSFTFERQQQDLAATSYELFAGCQVDKLSLTFKAGAIITGTFDVQGMSAPVPTTVSTSGATDVLAPTYGVLNAASNVGRLMENGALVATSPIETIGFDLNNNLGREIAVGTLGATALRDGEIGLTGAISAYFNDLNLLGKVLNDTPTSLMLRTGRSDGNRESILIDIPSVKLSGDSPVTAKNASRMFTGTYSARRHPTFGYTASWGRFWYLPVAA